MKGDLMEAYKLFSIYRNGSIGPLFINRKLRLNVGETYMAETQPTKGFVVRPGWHAVEKPIAPHLSKENRVWCKVRIEDFEAIQRPACQGGRWFLAEKLTVLEIMK